VATSREQCAAVTSNLFPINAVFVCSTNSIHTILILLVCLFTLFWSSRLGWGTLSHQNY